MALHLRRCARRSSTTLVVHSSTPRARREGAHRRLTAPDLPVSTRERSASLFRTVWIAAAAIVFGVFMEVGIRVPESTSSETQPAIAVNEEERPTAIPPSFRAIESLDLALKDRGFEPVVSKAIYRAELPDGRRLLLPVQRLSFQPE